MFKSEVYWVTGASSGLGREICILLSQRGARIVLSARRVEDMNKTLHLMDNQSQHVILAIDLSKQEQIEPAYQQLRNRGIQIDCLINCAGIGQRGRALTTSLSVEQYIMQVNFFAAAQISKLVIEEMLQRNKGRIVSIGSLAGKMGVPERSAYCASKHALVGFMDALRAEVSNHGVKVQVLNPGWVDTNLSSNALTADMTRYGKKDAQTANGLPARQCALKIIGLIAKGTEEAVIAQGKSLVGYYIAQWFPNRFHKLIRKIYKNQRK